jgi:hypothetical protein
LSDGSLTRYGGILKGNLSQQKTVEAEAYHIIRMENTSEREEVSGGGQADNSLHPRIG